MTAFGKKVWLGLGAAALISTPIACSRGDRDQSGQRAAQGSQDTRTQTAQTETRTSTGSGVDTRALDEAQKANERAANAQEKAADQQKDVADAQKDLSKSERELAEARQKVQKESQESQQAGQQAQQESQRAQQSQTTAQQRLEEQRDQQAQAEQAQSRQMQQTEQRSAEQQRQAATSQQQQQTVNGRVVKIDGEELVLRQEGGQQPDLRLKVEQGTPVMIDGRQAGIAELREGTQVRASYQESNGAPTATKIEAQGSGQQQQR